MKASLPNKIIIGVLAIQGSVREHLTMLHSLGVEARAVRTVAQLIKIDGLIIPGGESTTIGKLWQWYGLDKVITRRVKGGMPVYGTCAGAILLAKKIVGRQKANNLELIDITIERNAYGRQIDSFSAKLNVTALGKEPLSAVFIRAPQIKKVGKNVKIMAKYASQPVMVKENNILVSMFHPELTDDQRVHQYFVEMTKLSKHQIPNNI